MIDYIIRSGLCLTLLLGVYHLFLEREKMHRFNRFFLLFSLAFGLLAPLLTIEVPSEAAAFIPGMSDTEIAVQESFTIQDTVQPSIASGSKWDSQALVILIYVLGTSFFLVRFGRNLFKILLHISKNSRTTFESATLVLLSKDSLPHSFLNYIFINGDDYRNKRIEDQLFIHELTHVRQKHSLDVLFVEILRIVFWFNPIFILYKKAIQLNHEFLADEAVVKSHDVSAYQYLLLERSVSNHTIPLASNLNYYVTKKRLTMMIKHTSKLKIWTARLAVVPVLAVMLFFFSTKSVSESREFKSVGINNLRGMAQAPYEAFFKGSTIWIENKEGKFMPRKYDEMTAAEKAALPAPKLPKNIPTTETMTSWRTQPNVYAVWIDYKYVNNSELAKYKPDDFPLYRSRKPGGMDLRVNKNYGKFSYLVNLFTKNYYAERYIKPYNQPGKWLAVYKGEIWPGFSDGSDLIRRYFEIEELKKTNPEAGMRQVMPPFKPEKI